MRRILVGAVSLIFGCGDGFGPAGSPPEHLAPLESEQASEVPTDASTDESVYIAAATNSRPPVPDPPEAPSVEPQPIEHDFEALRAEYLATSPAFAAAMASMKVGVQPPADALRVPEPTYDHSSGLGCDKPVPPPSPSALARAGGYIEGRLDSDVAWTDRLAATPASDLVSPSTASDWVPPDNADTPPSDKPKQDEADP